VPASGPAAPPLAACRQAFSHFAEAKRRGNQPNLVTKRAGLQPKHLMGANAIEHSFGIVRRSVPLQPQIEKNVERLTEINHFH
jgi:hypothetical protein